MTRNGVPGAFGHRKWDEEIRRHLGGMPATPISPPRPPYGKLKAFSRSVGIHLLTLGGTPTPTIEWVGGRAQVGRNLGLRVELWVEGYLASDWTGLSAQFAEKPAHLCLYENDEVQPWLQAKPWKSDVQKTLTAGGLYLVAWPSSLKPERSNVGLTATWGEGGEYSVGAFVASFEAFLSAPEGNTKRDRVYLDSQGSRFVGFIWRFVEADGRLVVVVVRQTEGGQTLPEMVVV